MERHTKIVATLGPSSCTQEVIDRLIEAGLDVVRLNFSHGKAEDHIHRAELVRERARAHQRAIGVLADLQGPKIRIGKFKNGGTNLNNGDKFILDINCGLNDGDDERVGLTYPELIDDVGPGDILLLNDGLIRAQVDRVEGEEIFTTIVHGGELTNNKGINKLGGGLSAPALTDKDREDIKTVALIEADYMAVSFPREADDIHDARRLLREAGGHASIIAKMERAEAIDNMEEIVNAADGVMVARGDLGVEIGDAAIPPVQKRMIRMARERNKISITATQMMESMIQNPVPTRAEVSDVANAVMDGTDAVMLSAETAAGKYPVETVAAMNRVCVETEKHLEPKMHQAVLDRHQQRVDEMIAVASALVASRMNIRAIASFTESGSTAILMSRALPQVPIYALTPQTHTRRKLTLVRGVYPINFKVTPHDLPLEAMRTAEEELVNRGAVHEHDLMLFTIGEPMAQPGGTNTLKIIRIGAAKQRELDETEI